MKFYKPGGGRAIVLNGTSLQGYVDTTYKSIPHAYGGVPYPDGKIKEWTMYSPCIWGCTGGKSCIGDTNDII